MFYKLYFCSCIGDNFVLRYKGLNMEVKNFRIVLEANNRDDLMDGLKEADTKILSNLNKISAL